MGYRSSTYPKYQSARAREPVDADAPRGVYTAAPSQGGAQRAARQKLVVEPHFVAVTRIWVMTSRVGSRKKILAKLSFAVVVSLER